MHGKLALVGAADMHSHRSNLQYNLIQKTTKSKHLVEQHYEHYRLSMFTDDMVQ